MKTTAFINIATLITNDPKIGKGKVGHLQDAAIIVEGEKIAWVGSSDKVSKDVDALIDLEGRTLIPGFVESHSHLVFAGSRVEEFQARMAGSAYQAGGIAATVAATRLATDDTLRSNVFHLTDEFIRSGTTSYEIKSGYGLTVIDEVRSLRIAQEFSKESTFLGAHVLPPEYLGKKDAYVDLVTTQMLKEAAPYSKWIDVFCERGAFDADQAREILMAGKNAGLIPRIHANQLELGDGVKVALDVGAASADHLTYLSDDDIDLLSQGSTVATLLPAAQFSTRSPYPRARDLIDAGARVALSTDCNPGSSYTTSMAFCIALAVREMHMTPDEGIWSATAGGAAALQRSDIGIISEGASADLVILSAPSHVFLAYRPGVDLIDQVWRSGTLSYTNNRKRG